MIVGQPSKENLWKYREIFASPLDYEAALRNYELVQLKQMYDLPLTEKDVFNFRRINRLRNLGGIRKPLTQKEVDIPLESLGERDRVPMIVSN